MRIERKEPYDAPLGRVGEKYFLHFQSMYGRRFLEFRDINAIKAFRSAITKAIRIYEKQQKATEEQK